MHTLELRWELGTWVYDDAELGVYGEPFVLGADTILTQLRELHVGPGRDPFRITFSAAPFPGALEGSDFFNSGSKATTITNAPDSFVFFTPSFNLQWGELGVGFSLEMSQYALSTNTLEARDAQAIRATIPIAHIQFAHGLFNNQWVIGVGARFASLWVDGVSDAQSFNSSGSGLELGMVYKPEGLPLRVGASVRSAIRTEAELNEGFLPDENGDLVLTD